MHKYNLVGSWLIKNCVSVQSMRDERKEEQHDMTRLLSKLYSTVECSHTTYMLLPDLSIYGSLYWDEDNETNVNGFVCCHFTSMGWDFWSPCNVSGWDLVIGGCLICYLKA